MMELIFSSYPSRYKSFSFDFKRGSKEYEAFFGVGLASLQTEYKRNATVIMEHMAKMAEPKSVFKIDGGLSVDFNNESKSGLDYIIDDFISKLKYKKYKPLGLWIPLLQDHFWNNAEKGKQIPRKKKKSNPPSIKKPGLSLRPSLINLSIKTSPTPWEEDLIPEYDEHEEPEVFGIESESAPKENIVFNSSFAAEISRLKAGRTVAQMQQQMHEEQLIRHQEYARREQESLQDYINRRQRSNLAFVNTAATPSSVAYTITTATNQTIPSNDSTSLSF